MLINLREATERQVEGTGPSTTDSYQLSAIKFGEDRRFDLALPTHKESGVSSTKF